MESPPEKLERGKVDQVPCFPCLPGMRGHTRRCTSTRHILFPFSYCYVLHIIIMIVASLKADSSGHSWRRMCFLGAKNGKGPRPRLRSLMVRSEVGGSGNKSIKVNPSDIVIIIIIILTIHNSCSTPVNSLIFRRRCDWPCMVTIGG